MVLSSFIAAHQAGQCPGGLFRAQDAARMEAGGDCAHKGDGRSTVPPGNTQMYRGQPSTMASRQATRAMVTCCVKPEARRVRARDSESWESILEVRMGLIRLRRTSNGCRKGIK